MLVKSTVKYIQSLSHKKLRNEFSLFVAEGPKLFNELYAAPNISLKEVFATREWIMEHHDITEPVQQLNEVELGRISAFKTANQVIAVFSQPVYPPELGVANNITLLLDGIQDPGNLGTIIRCADWFGIGLIVCSAECADVYSPKVVQSTMGSICRVQVLYQPLDNFMKKYSHIPVYAASLEGTEIRQMLPVKEGMLLIGNESRGIQQSLLAKATYKIKIAGNGQAESLNAAVATGILLAFMRGG